MASYTTRQREPLLDQTTQEVLQRRSKELIGMALIFAAFLFGLMLWSYSPDDPNWLLSSDQPVQNWLGRTGASLAAPLMMVVGLASWVFVFALGAWGVRFITHIGPERLLSRLIMLPFAVILASLYCATLTPGPEWTHRFGVGGLFGDTVLSILITLLPIGVGVSLKLWSLVLGLALLVLALLAYGCTRHEVKQGANFAFFGLVVLYSWIVSLTKGGLREGNRLRQDMWAERRSAPARSEPAAEIRTRAPAQEGKPSLKASRAMIQRPQGSVQGSVSEPQMTDVAYEPEDMVETPAEQGANSKGFGLKSFLSPLTRRSADVAAEPLPVVEEQPLKINSDSPVDPATQARITDAIRARLGRRNEPAITRTEDGVRIEPGLTKGKGPRPLVVAQRTAEPDVLMQAMSAAGSAVPSAPQSHAPEPFMLEAEAATHPMPEADLLVDMDDLAINAAPAPMPAAGAKPAASGQSLSRVVKPAVGRKIAPSKAAQAEAQPALAFEAPTRDYETPPLALLEDPANQTRLHLSDEELEENARALENVLEDYGVKGDIVSVRPGPVVTMYELEPAPGLKASRVIGLADDIARSMSALAARVSTVPGRTIIGIELPNEQRETVLLREILAAKQFGDSNLSLPLALGKDISGDPVVANLAKMPHLLIAGTTGSGKSVAINTMIMSLLYKLTPDECRLIMIDPKMLELSVYDGIPHLLSPVVTDPKKAVVALKWVVGEMEERYRKMSKMGVRNIEGYNSRVRDTLAKGETFSRTVQTGFDEETGDPIFETEEITPEAMPYIVVIVDEMADLMMVAGKEIEACIQRLAQMARASGIHLIMATQRPSVDVITGTIKANFPTRISFQVTSKIDSRTILGEMGAEQLLGQGDMLYLAGGARLTRVHGPFVSDEEVEEIVNHLKAYGPPDYKSGVVEGPDEEAESNIDLVLGLGGNTNGEDALYDQAVAIVAQDRKCSTSYIQRKLAIGYNKAARLVEQMEEEGLVSPANHVGKREILLPEPN